MSTPERVSEKQVLSFAPGYLTEPLSPRENIRLLGTRCSDCGATLLGSRERCENCSSSNVEVKPLSKEGKVWTYTILRYPSPWPFSVPNPYTPPRPVAWVELTEGVRLVSQVRCQPEEIEIGMPVSLVVEKGWEDDNGNDVLMYHFSPTGGKR